MKFIYDRINAILTELKKHIIIEKHKLDGFLYSECGYKTDNILPLIDESFSEFKVGQRWGGKNDKHFWFYKKLVTDKPNMEFELITGKEGGWDADNPQFIVYLNGEIVQALDINHTTLLIEKAGEYDLYLYAYTGGKDELYEFIPSLNIKNEKCEELYYDIKIPFEICSYLETDDRDFLRITDALNDTINLIDLREPHSKEFNNSILSALKYIKEYFYEKYKNSSDITTICIGHTHIDIAWLWTVRQTREKAVRSFSTVVSLMKRYPEYKFMSSQAILFKYVKEDAPELYEEIKKFVSVGQFEIEGSMLVEADCNLSSGESLIRQILFGKRFFKEEFSVDCKTLWLPDVFGYSAALPQILTKCNVDKFVTSKISWNETNQMPNDTFMWQGIDGTEIFSYFLTAQDKKRGRKPAIYTTYVANTTPAMIAGTWERYQNKILSNESLVTFGHGDGGGGPTKEMLEYARRLEYGVIGCPKAKIDTATNFLNKLKANTENNPKMPKWVGELYLELHRGTYTSIAKNKRNNRKSELLFRNIELLSSMNMILNKKEYPTNEINNSWETILINQFHDIIPGSSIKEVYDDTDKEYGEIFELGNNIVDNNVADIAGNIKTQGGMLVFNPNSFENSGIVTVDDRAIFVENIPAMGYKVVSRINADSGISVSENILENSKIKIIFNDQMEIASIFDKELNREVLTGTGNKIIAYEDFPRAWDAWEISDYYTEKSWSVSDVSSVTTVDLGDVKGIEIKRKFMSSVIIQKILLSKNSKRIDFETYADWKQEHILLKVEFPVNVHANKATYDIQFGTVERPTHKNTSWEKAKFEVCAHKFADLSQPDFGVSLLNDCKYGYDIAGQNMRLTLLKCATYPNPDADKGEHRFTYSIYPHKGDYRQGQTVFEAYKLNAPMSAVLVDSQNGTLADCYSHVSCENKNIIIETVKKAEDSNEIIVRLYDSFGVCENAKINFGFNIKEIYHADMMENNLEKITCNNNQIEIDVKPFEIVTLKVAY